MDEQNALRTLQYSIAPEEYEKAFSFYQRRYVFWKNWLITGIFVVFSILFLQQMIVDPSYVNGWIALGISVAVIGVSWYNTFRLRRHVVLAVTETRNDVYTTSFTEEDITIRTALSEESDSGPMQPRIISYALDAPEVFETPDAFILNLRKQLFFVIPKKPLSEEDIAFLRTQFQEKLQSKFRNEIKSREKTEAS